MKKTIVVAVILVALFAGVVVSVGIRNSHSVPMSTTEQKSEGMGEIVATSSVDDTTDTAVQSEPESPAIIALDIKPWEWVTATYADGRTVSPNAPGDFTMTFSASGGVSFSTDCNSMSSSYEAYASGLTFGPIASTKMYCEGSKETEFAALISETKTYRFTDTGELILETATGDTMLFE